MKRLLRALRLLLIGGLVLLSALLAVAAWWGSGRLTMPPRRALEDYHRRILDQPADHGLEVKPFTAGDGTPCLLVTPTSQPGKAEKARLLRAELESRGVPLPPWGEVSGTVVLFYGHGARKEDHLPICERFCAAGLRCVLPDLPAQGDHPAGVARFGVEEKALAARVLDDAGRQFGFDPGPSCLFGISQGGAIALQTAAAQPDRWRAVASISTFASLDQPVSRSARAFLPTPFKALAPLAAGATMCGTRLRAGFWPQDVRPLDAASHLQMPAFIGHGDRDAYIGIEQGREIFAAIPATRKHFRNVEGGDHGRVLAVGSTALYADLCQFFLAAIPPAVEQPPRAE